MGKAARAVKVCPQPVRSLVPTISPARRDMSTSPQRVAHRLSTGAGLALDSPPGGGLRLSLSMVSNNNAKESSDDQLLQHSRRQARERCHHLQPALTLLTPVSYTHLRAHETRH